MIATQPAIRETVLAAQSGDRAAQGEMYNRYHRLVRSVIRSVAMGGVGHHTEEDLLQDTFVRLFDSLPGLNLDDPRNVDDEAFVRQWVCVRVRSVVANVRAGLATARRNIVRTHAIADGLEVIDPIGPADKAAEEADERAMLRYRIARLGKCWSKVIIDHYFDELSVEDIAVKYGIKETSVRVLLSQAKGKLAERLDI